MDFSFLLGLENECSLCVSHADTAAVYGSGALEVFATPAMIALMEKTCLQSIADKIGEENTSVGTKINISHDKATPIGKTVVCYSKIVEIDRRRLVFDVQCTENDIVIGKGLHERFVVDKEKFMNKL